MEKSSKVKIGFLTPFNSYQEEVDIVSSIPIFEGVNVLGRNDLSISDKRVSRKHISLNANIHGSAEVFVEGPNPILVKSGDQRKKICFQEKVTVVHGDVLEFIPGNFIFQFISLGHENWASSSRKNVSFSLEEKNLSNGETLKLKRKRQVLEGEDFCQTLQDDQRKSSGSLATVKHDDSLCQSDTVVGSYSNSEAIRCFRVNKDEISPTFRLLHVQGLPQWANSSSVSIDDVIQGNVIFAVLSNYMVDMDWLISACPMLGKIPHGLVIHGESGDRVEHMKKSMPPNWVLHHPPLPISYGTHHSKAMLLVYPQGVRVVVHTANLIYVDWNYKSQGLWMQDFPWKDQTNLSRASSFENDLIDYLNALMLPEVRVNLPVHGNVNVNASFFKKFDYSNASVRLVASVPGYHKGSNLKKWGHMKLQTILQDCVFDKEFERSPLVYQFSSLGSLDEKWMAELASSMSSGFSEDKTPLGLGKAMLIWPTVEDVRCSLEGYAAGNAIPSPQKNVEKDFLKKYWARWKGDHTGRGRAMPHIKTFARYNGQKLAWFLLTSSNLSKAAWGALQKNSSQLMIRSYELGVLFLPSTIKGQRYSFSCTDNGHSTQVKCESSHNAKGLKIKLVTLCWQGSQSTDSASSAIIRLPVPYELPPQPYEPGDVPWSWDRRYTKKDVHGQVWPRHVQFYVDDNS